MYPIMLTVKNRPCLVVGGGGIAVRKLNGLLDDGATVTVVAESPAPVIVQLAADGAITLEQRSYCPGEATDYRLVIAATDDREVNRQVFTDADGAGVLVNVVDDPPLCTFHLPARVQRGTLQIAIASEGEAPFAVRRLRQIFEQRIGHHWSEWMEAAARFRRKVREQIGDPARAEDCYDAFFCATVDAESLTARVPTAAEESAYFCNKGPDGVATAPDNDAISDPAAAEHAAGLVSLVGSGPGDPKLLTLRAWQRLMAADAVVYDRLAATTLPCNLPARVELHCVGKQAGTHPVPQEEINALLVRLAHKYRRVVRLKGGDPYIFGRGSEEAEVLQSAGVPFEIVPGVTAATAVPAYAGIPVTHRQEAVRATLVTAHESSKVGGPQVRWDLLGQDPHASLLGYMGVTSLPNVVEKLLEAGLDPQTPAAMISRGTTSAQHVVKATVAALPQAIIDEDLQPPALFAIGPTVAHAERLDWFGSRPLQGQRLVMTAPTGPLASELELAGAEIVEVGLPVTPSARVVMGALPLTGCVLRSADDVEALDDERLGLGWGREVVAWCLGPAAAERARRLGWQRVEELDDEQTGVNFVPVLQRARRQR